MIRPLLASAAFLLMTGTAMAQQAAPVGGYLLDDVAGGPQARAAQAIHAHITPLAANAVGLYMNRQEAELRAIPAIQVVRQGDDLIVTLPANPALGRAVVQPVPRAALDQVAAVLARYNQSFVDVYGHTDSIGTDGANQALSARRARAVSAYLAAHGVKPARLGARGYGEMQPVANNASPDGRLRNRRVELKIVPVVAR